MAVNPFAPNLPDYRAFVYGMASKAAAGYPSAAGTVSGGTTWRLTDISATWKPNQWVSCVVLDVTQNWSGIVISNTGTEVDFIITPAGNPGELTPAPGDQYLIVQAGLQESLDIAVATVNETLSCASPLLYTKAVYNLALDRLINFGIDVQGQTWLQDLRKGFGVLSIESGVVAAASDQGTSGSMLVPDQFRTFTLDDLQLMKTPFGRNYLSIAQNYGPTLFGVS